MYVYIYIYIYIYIFSDAGGEQPDRATEGLFEVGLAPNGYVDIYIYIYRERDTYTCTHTYIKHIQ